MTEFEHNFDWLVGEIDKAKEKARVLFSKSLALPKEAPAADKLVAIDTNNGQELIGIGSGLTLENGELKASGGGGDNTPVTITIDRMMNNYTITGSTYATLLDDFKVKNVILKDDLALSTYTVKVTTISGLADDVSYKLIYLNDGTIGYVGINKDGSITG